RCAEAFGNLRVGVDAEGGRLIAGLLRYLDREGITVDRWAFAREARIERARVNQLIERTVVAVPDVIAALFGVDGIERANRARFVGRDDGTLPCRNADADQNTDNSDHDHQLDQ